MMSARHRIDRGRRVAELPESGAGIRGVGVLADEDGGFTNRFILYLFFSMLSSPSIPHIETRL